MVRYAAFLRGLNLGRRRVRGEELTAPFVALGFREVASYQASGNVAFTAAGDEASLTSALEGALEAALGYPVRTFLRTAAEVGAIVARAPFSVRALDHSTGQHQVFLLAKAPEAEAARTALAHATEEDRLVLHGRELHWLPAGRMSESALDLRAIERLVGPTTLRTAGTLARFHARFLDEAC